MADSIREALTAAIDKAETTEPETDATETPASPGADDATAGDGGEPNPQTTEASGLEGDGAEAPPSKEGAAPAAPAAPAAEPEVAAPVSWSTAERAEWSKVPKSARDAVLRREGEMNRALQASAVARRRVEAIDQIASPYKPLLDSYGVGVEQVIPSLLATRAALEVGTPQQKATLVANLCADFGLDIDLLDTALGSRYQNGQPAPRYNGGPPQMADLRNHPQLSGLFQLAETVSAAQQERAAAVVGEIQTLPHYETVRLTVADFVDKAKAAGQPIDLPRFYGLACQLHGLEAPAAAPSAPVSTSEAAAILARSRKAASSVGGAPKPTPPRKPGEGTLRDELEANIAAAR